MTASGQINRAIPGWKEANLRIGTLSNKARITQGCGCVSFPPPRDRVGTESALQAVRRDDYSFIQSGSCRLAQGFKDRSAYRSPVKCAIPVIQIVVRSSFWGV